MLEPKEIEVTHQDGKTGRFILSKFPAIAGREIIINYPVANIPKLQEYAASEEVMLKLMAHVQAIPESGNPINLTTRALIDNHVRDWETLARLEWQMLEYNCSFFGNGLNSDSLQALSQKAIQFFAQMLMGSLQQSSAAAKPPSKN